MDEQQRQEKRGIPQYRCQRCMEVAMNSEAPPIPIVPVITVLTKNPLVIEHNDVQRMCGHECRDGGIGIASLIGFFPEERLPELREAQRQQAEAAAQDRKNAASKSAN